MNLDLHVHTVYSLDSPVTPEQYVERMLELKKTHHIHGMVFMEHKLLEQEFDYQGLARESGLVILHGTEADTMYGHLLCYGITDELFENFGLQTRCRDTQALINAMDEISGAAVPAHPFRNYMSMGLWLGQLEQVYALEALNGGSSEEENTSATNAARRLGLAGTGGSDAHFLGELGCCLTRFETEIYSIEDLCREIRSGRSRAIRLQDALKE